MTGSFCLAVYKTQFYICSTWLEDKLYVNGIFSHQLKVLADGPFYHILPTHPLIKPIPQGTAPCVWNFLSQKKKKKIVPCEYIIKGCWDTDKSIFVLINLEYRCVTSRGQGREFSPALLWKWQKSALIFEKNAGFVHLWVTFPIKYAVLRVSRRKHPEISPFGTFLSWVVDEMFIEEPLF